MTSRILGKLAQDSEFTEGRTLETHYWVFDASKPFSFTIEPFLQLPERYKKSKHTIKELVVE